MNPWHSLCACMAWENMCVRGGIILNLGMQLADPADMFCSWRPLTVATNPAAALEYTEHGIVVGVKRFIDISTCGDKDLR